MPKKISKPEQNVSLQTRRGPERDKKFVQVSFDLIERGRYLTPQAKWLYVVLRSFKNKERGTFPGYVKIMERGGLKRNAVAKGLKELERFGWIVRSSSGKKRSNAYEFHYPSTVIEGTEEEYGSQVFPTEELAKEWAAGRRKTKKKD
jgi:hypothetical protein